MIFYEIIDPKHSIFFSIEFLGAEKRCIAITTLSGETFSGEIFVGRNLRHYTKNSSFSADVRPIKVKVSLDDVQMKLRGKKVI